LLSEHEDVTVTRLVSGKVTFVHRSLWSKLVAIGKAREDWQMSQLSTRARRLLDELDEQGTLVTTSLGRFLGPKPGNAVRELELKLLIHADQIHTSSGRHAKVLETWDNWTKRNRFKALRLKPESARRFFDKRLQAINERHQGCGRLPWS